MKVVKMKYIGDTPRRFYLFGLIQPGEIVFTPARDAKKILETKLFELYDGSLLPMVVKIKRKEDCIKCPKKRGD